MQLPTKRPASAPVAEPVPTSVVLYGLSPSMESLLQDHPHVATASAYRASLETQQLDHSAQQAALDEVNDTLDKYDEAHPRTGPLHVYLLGNPGAASFDQDNETTPMKALVNAALRDKSKVVAALMPEDETVFKVADIPTSLTLRQLADTILTTESIPMLVGKAAFEDFLKDPTSLGFKPATEGIGTVLVLGALTAFVVHGLRDQARELKSKQDAWKAQKEQAARAKQIKDSFANPENVKKIQLVGGTVSAADIAGPLFLVQAEVNVKQLVDHAAVSARGWAEPYAKACEAFVPFLNKEGAAFDKSFASAGAPQKAAMIQAFAHKLQQNDPLAKHPPKLTGFLSALAFNRAGPSGSDFKPVKASTLTELPALDHAGIQMAAAAVGDLLEAAAFLKGCSEEIKEASYNLAEIDAEVDEDEEKDDILKAGYYLQEVYYAKSFRSLFAWPLDDLAEKMEAGAKALSHWIDRSVKK